MPFLGRIATWYQYQTGVVLVPLMQRQNGTGTIQVVSVPLSRIGLVPVPNIVVPVPQVPATPVFGIFA